jgi:uncharacterized membrane protein
LNDAALNGRKGTTLENALAGLRARLQPAGTREAAVALRVVYAGVLAYAVLFAFAAVVHYQVFEIGRGDLGNMVQAIWNTLHGHFLQTTTPSGRLTDRLGFHVDPFLLLLVPLFWIWSSPLLLLVVQAFAVASGALPVFWLARKHLGSPRAGAHFALAYLLYPATQFSAFSAESGFHAVSIAVPLVLFAVWFLDEDRLVAFSVVAVLACTTKEEIPLAVGCLGLWYAVRRGRWLFGLGVLAVGLAITLFNFLWVIPHFSPGSGHPYADRYRAIGGTPGGVAHKLFTDPVAVVHAVATGHKALYLVLLFVPFLGLWALEPLLVLGAVPDLAINLLSNEPDQTSVAFHHTGGIIPFVIAASIFGAVRFKRHADRISLWALAATAAIAAFSPIFLLPGDVRALGSPLVSAKAHAVSLVPPDASVSASNQLGGHLSGRHVINTFPLAVRADWIVVDLDDPTYSDRAGYRRQVRRYEADRAWRIVFSSHGITVLHKRSADRK